MASALFVCVHNACRSQIAESICKNLAPISWTVASAGTNPSSSVDPKAVVILKRNGLIMNSAHPKGLSDLPAIKWNFVITMGCGNLSPYISAKQFHDWNISDPNDGPMELYEKLFLNLSERIQYLIYSAPHLPGIPKKKN